MIDIQIDFDEKPRTTPLHTKLRKVFKGKPEVKTAFDRLAPSRQKVILRYINFLKTEESVERNIERVVAHLVKSKPFIGRERK